MHKFINAELYKINKKKSILKAMIVILVVFLLLVVVIEASYAKQGNGSRKNKFFNPNVISNPSKPEEKGVKEYDQEIIQLETAIRIQELKYKNEEKNMKLIEKTSNRKTINLLKDELILYKYLRDNNIKPNNASIVNFDGTSALKSITAHAVISSIEPKQNLINIQTFVYALMGIATTLISYLTILMTARSYAGEINSGEMRFILSKPIKKSTVVTSKLLAVIFANIIAITIVFLVSLIYGMTLSRDIVTAYSVVGSNVYKIGLAMLLLLPLLDAYLKIIFLAVFTMFVGSIIRKPISGIVIGFVIIIFGGLISKLLDLIGLGFMELYSIMGFLSTLTVAPRVNHNIFGQMLYYSGYLFFFATCTYVIHNKKDIA